jgi:protein-L-isoaspartate(D-aspartate) O-methyltransferase
MNEALQLEIGHKVLEIGAGSGWHAATVAEIIAPSNTPRSNWGHVYTIEIVQELAEFARKTVMKAGYGDRVTIVSGDGSIGCPEQAPYDRILVTAAAPEVPEPLLKQLRPGGVMLIPIGDVMLFQTLIRITKSADGKTKRENLGGVAFVPLTGRFGHQP